MNKRSVSLILLVLLIAVLGLLVLRNPELRSLLSDQENMSEWVARWGALAPLVMVALQAAQVILAPIPGQVMGLVSGYLFGVARGAAYSLAGNALGSLVVFSLARVYGRPFVERRVPSETLARLDAGAERRGLFFFVLVFLVPFLPDDLTCFAAGLTPIPIPALMIAILVGRPPGILVSCWLGANAAVLGPAQWTVVVVCSALVAGLFLRYGAQLQEWTMRLTERLTPRKRH